MATYQLNVNGQRKQVNVDPSTPLLWILREELKLTGTKYGCGISACGACTVHVDGIATRSCVVPVSLVGDRPIVTIEGVGTDPVGRAVQDAWIEKDVVQCGYCQSGQIMSAVALLKATPKPTDTNIEESMGGNLCRCADRGQICRTSSRSGNRGCRPKCGLQSGDDSCRSASARHQTRTFAAHPRAAVRRRECCSRESHRS